MGDKKPPPPSPGTLTFTGSAHHTSHSLKDILPTLHAALGNTAGNKHNSTIAFLQRTQDDSAVDLNATIRVLNTAINEYFEVGAQISLIIQILEKKKQDRLENPAEIIILLENLADVVINALHATDPKILKHAFEMNDEDIKQFYDLIKKKDNLANVLSWFEQLEKYSKEQLKPAKDKTPPPAKSNPEIHALLISIQKGASVVRQRLQVEVTLTDKSSPNANSKKKRKRQE